MSTKLTIKEAIQRIGKSESPIRRDMRSGKVSYSKSENGRVQFDTAELQRVYGELKPVDTATDTAPQGKSFPVSHQPSDYLRQKIPSIQKDTSSRACASLCYAHDHHFASSGSASFTYPVTLNLPLT